MIRLRRPFALAAILAISGVAGQQATGAQSPPAATPWIRPMAASSRVARDIDIGGRSMHLVCVSTPDPARPTVILEAGLGYSSGTFDKLMPVLDAASVHACAYDRAGLGASDPPPDGAAPGSGPVTTADGARDLHELLTAAGILPPYVLAAHSVGGWYAWVFTAAYPDDVVGLVLIDSSHPDQDARVSAMLPPARPGEDRRLTDFRPVFALANLPVAADYGWLDLAASASEVRASGDLGDRPLVVLTAGDDPAGLPEPYEKRLADAWLGMQDELASLSSNGAQRTVPDAAHFIQVDQPAAVAQAIEDVLAAIAARAGNESDPRLRHIL